MSRPKITEEYPLTVPHLCQRTGYHAELIKKLMPPADHWSGTTPRWRAGRSMPPWSFALLLKRGEKELRSLPLRELLPAMLPDVVAWLPDGIHADQIRRAYMRCFWTIPAGQERQWIANQAKQLGGY